MMNKIYFAVVDEDMGGVYISAPNLKVAKKLALTEHVIVDYMHSYIDLKCWCVRDDGKIKKTNLPTKVLTIDEILQERCHWWDCYKCGQGEYFEYAGIGQDGFTDYCKCPECGVIFEIPYVD